MKLTYFRNLFFATAMLFSVAIVAHDNVEELNLEKLTYVECELRLKGSGLHRHERHCHGKPFTAFTRPHMPLKEGTSENWSGYAAVTSLNHPAAKVVTAVSGTWVVPTLSPSSQNTWSSIWVGIDGFSSSTVEQIGTEHDWYNGAQQNYAWFEMYPNFAFEIVGFPARPGDVISASVVYQGNNVFLLSIANSTAGVRTSVPTKYTKSKVAQRSSAEWIVEAPFSGSTLPLAHFNNVFFSRCTATINKVTGSISDRHWAHDALTMVTRNGVAKAIPSALSANGQMFSVAWNHE